MKSSTTCALLAVILWSGALLGAAGFTPAAAEGTTVAEVTPGAVSAQVLNADLAADPATAAVTLKATPGFVTNIFADEDIRQALRDIAMQSGTVIIPDATVQGVVTCELRNTPVEQALDMVLFAGGYAYKKVGDYYLVGSPDPKNPSFSSLASVERVPLRQTHANEVFEALNPVYHAYVQQDANNNVLVVTAPDKLLRQIVEQIRSIDQPAEQVMIEVMVVEVSTGAAKELGVRWRFSSFGFDVGDPLTSGGSSRISGDNNSLSWTEASPQDMANLRLLVGKDLADIRANPRVSTLNGREAEIFVGRQEFFSVVTGNAYYPTTQLQEVNAGITLKIKPYVGENGKLLIHLDPEVSDVIGQSTNGSPIVARRRVHTVVRSETDKTIVIGGLTQVIKQMRETKVPVLGDVPVIGHLFRQRVEDKQETEIVIFLRPHILSNGSASTWQPAGEWPTVQTESQKAATAPAAGENAVPAKP